MADEKNKILFKKFKILECLKKDPGTCVYCADHIYLGKRILLKTLDRDFISDPAILSRFQREAKTLAKLDFPNIIKVLDFGTFDRFFYISFEYFESRTLRGAIKSGDLSDADKKNILIQFFRALDYAHNHQIIHRDIKPENILLDEHGTLKIADFGLAHVHGEESLTQQTTIVGTPSYMSPEQIRGEALTTRSDLFSAGVVAYELYSGKNPFLGNDVGATLNNILTKNVVADETFIQDEAVRHLVNQLLFKNKNARIASAAAALTMLGDEPQREQATATAKSAKPVRRISVVAGFAVILVVVVTAAVIYPWRQAPPVQDDEINAVIDSTSGLADQEKAAFADTLEKMPEIVSQTEDMPAATREKLSSQATPGRLYINCLPWAHVFVNSQKRNTTPLQDALELAPGDYTIRLEHPVYPAYVKNIRIESEKDYHIDATLYSYLVCNVFPWGDVYLNGELLGQTPFAEPLIIGPGEHVLTVKNQEYGSIDKRFSVSAGDTFRLSLNFEQTGEYLMRQ